MADTPDILQALRRAHDDALRAMPWHVYRGMAILRADRTRTLRGTWVVCDQYAGGLVPDPTDRGRWVVVIAEDLLDQLRQQGAGPFGPITDSEIAAILVYHTLNHPNPVGGVHPQPQPK
jgi:hypothetical protein